MKLFACRLPHAQVPKQDQTGPDRQPFVMEPGMEIALHVDGSITADRDKITEELEKNIAQNGWGLKPDAPIVMTARIATDPPRDVFYESGRLVFETTYHQMNRGLPKNNPSVVPKNNQQEPPKASYVSPRLELDIKKADKVLWKIFAFAAPQCLAKRRSTDFLAGRRERRDSQVRLLEMVWCRCHSREDPREFQIECFDNYNRHLSRLLIRPIFADPGSRDEGRTPKPGQATSFHGGSRAGLQGFPHSASGISNRLRRTTLPRQAILRSRGPSVRACAADARSARKPCRNRTRPSRAHRGFPERSPNHAHPKP